MKPRVYGASDYAGLETDNAKFYYGYEETEGDEWCFTAEFNNQKIKVPASKLQVKDTWDCVYCLLVGIGWVVTKYGIAKEVT